MIHALIDTSTAAAPTGLATQHKLFRVEKGPFAGRLLALFARTPTNLALSYTSDPYTSWLDPGDFVTDAADLPFDAVADENADVWVAYTQQTTGALICVRLIFVNGTWVAQTPATVYDSPSSTNKHPTVLKDMYGRIWVAWTREDSGTYTLRVKSSLDLGQTFGSGPTDAGTDLSGNTSSCYGTLIARANYIHCLFAIAGTTLKNREIEIDAALWNAAVTLYTGAGLGSDLAAAVSSEGMLGALFAADSKLYLKEYDGAVWGALQTVSTQPAASPALRYMGTAPYALFLHNVGTDQNELYESHRVGSSFAAPTSVLSQAQPFASVFCFDADAGTPYADVTTAAASSAAADVFHPTSEKLLQAVGDAVFLGSDDRFSFIRILLSTAGAGGAVTWSYWNGAWTDFIPASGASGFDAVNDGVRLFNDGIGTPVDWQKTVINGANRYWIRAVVGTAFTTAPVGTQLTAVPNMSGVVPRVA
ncbi:MAG: hypothetical protein AB1792_11130 [Candidatus Zixiibacteriota bacterium]